MIVDLKKAALMLCSVFSIGACCCKGRNNNNNEENNNNDDEKDLTKDNLKEILNEFITDNDLIGEIFDTINTNPSDISISGYMFTKKYLNGNKANVIKNGQRVFQLKGGKIKILDLAHKDLNNTEATVLIVTITVTNTNETKKGNIVIKAEQGKKLVEVNEENLKLLLFKNITNNKVIEKIATLLKTNPTDNIFNNSGKAITDFNNAHNNVTSGVADGTVKIVIKNAMMGLARSGTLLKNITSDNFLVTINVNSNAVSVNVEKGTRVH